MTYITPQGGGLGGVLIDAAEAYAEAATLVPDGLTAIMLQEASEYYQVAAGRVAAFPESETDLMSGGGATLGPVAPDAGYQVIFDTEARVQGALDAEMAALTGGGDRMDLLATLYDASASWVDDLSDDVHRAE